MQADVYDEVLKHVLAARGRKPFVVGLCGPQGSGKSTLARRWEQQLLARGVRAVTLSLDDFYLTRAERATLGTRVHPLLATRGVPGTHDVSLALQTLAALGGTGHVALPMFDKAQDDRCAPAAWPRVDAPAQIVIFEGWCVGAMPQSEQALAAPINTLERQLDADGYWRHYVNAELAGVYQTLFGRIDRLVLLQPPSFDVVFAWRREQELALRHASPTAAGVMNDDQLHRFIQHYERLTRHILEEMPARAQVVIELDAQRRGRVVMKE